MKTQKTDTAFQKRCIKAFLRVEVIPEDSMKSLNAKKSEYPPWPSAGGYAVSKNGAVFQFDFLDSEMRYEATEEGIFCDIEQYSFDLECYKESWVKNGFIEESMLDKQMESIAFQAIKDAEKIDEIHVDMWDEHYKCEMIVREFVLVDAYSGEQVDLMRHERRVNPLMDEDEERC